MSMAALLAYSCVCESGCNVMIEDFTATKSCSMAKRKAWHGVACMTPATHGVDANACFYTFVKKCIHAYVTQMQVSLSPTKCQRIAVASAVFTQNNCLHSIVLVAWHMVTPTRFILKRTVVI